MAAYINEKLAKMSLPDDQCVNSTPQADCSTSETVVLVATTTENGGNNGTNTLIVETPKSSLPSTCTLSPAKHSSSPTITPPCTLTLKSSTSLLMADIVNAEIAIAKDLVHLAPEGCAPKMSSTTTLKTESTEEAKVIDDEELDQDDLLKWKDMPRHLQFNRYIVEGYRPLTDAKGCIHSLFYFHNETVNIFTHGNL